MAMNPYQEMIRPHEQILTRIENGNEQPGNRYVTRESSAGGFNEFSEAG
jgi:hypothetical protein